MAMADRRRINGPSSTTTTPVFLPSPAQPPARCAPTELRKIFLKTSLTPPATGSAFLELSLPSTLKLTASVYGPRPLPPSAVFSPHACITAELKFAPFSTLGARRGYVRDALERDLSAQLQVALSRAIKTAAYPKSGIDVFVTVLDCEGAIDDEGLGAMQALAGAITCASAAVADAGIECVDLVSAGIAALVEVPGDEGLLTVLDPSPLDGYDVKAAALVAYMAGRDEISLLWVRGEVEGSVFDGVVDSAVQVAAGVRAVVNEAVKERVVLAVKAGTADVDMSG
ncbi:3' exoribonuclease family, domain 1-domain-containing protein [Tricharina praecox]|uniref:3' exoribonuclease family, domain 1-domain-containing protein n=1 Tax=Tricharina praecox TaxID=43433 RepID=UPI00221F5BBC|nr:3' exoribonuclease family, domain 1-domain-containing protein [Tricharina praecox]KAI5849193.1 3' exoribonuclease family, domain 1-domain-containing protein [Tricharina praecox]